MTASASESASPTSTIPPSPSLSVVSTLRTGEGGDEDDDEDDDEGEDGVVVAAAVVEFFSGVGRVVVVIVVAVVDDEDKDGATEEEWEGVWSIPVTDYLCRVRSWRGK